MDSDLIYFLLGIIGLIVYLIFSAKTEMGTKFVAIIRDKLRQANKYH